MDDPEATATQTPPDAPTVEVETPAVSTPVPEAPVAPDPTPAAEPEKPETPAAPPDPRDELEDERFKPHLDRIRRQEANRVQQEEVAKRQEAQASADAKEVGRAIANAYGNIAQRLKNEGVEVLDEWLPRLEAIAAPYSDKEREKLKGEGREAGNKAGQVELSQGILATVQHSLGQRAWEDMEDYFTTTSGLTWADILNKYHELRSGKSKEKITSLEAQMESLKNIKRPEGPDTTPKGGGGSKKYSELTPEERRAMSSAEVDAMQARERGEK